MTSADPSAPLLTPDTPHSDKEAYELPNTVIRFQQGAMALGRNGATTAEILNVLIAHMQKYQQGKFACRENAIVITKLEEALLWQEYRAKKREEQGVKGRDSVHA